MHAARSSLRQPRRFDACAGTGLNNSGLALAILKPSSSRRILERRRVGRWLASHKAARHFAKQPCKVERFCWQGIPPRRRRPTVPAQPYAPPHNSGYRTPEKHAGGVSRGTCHSDSRIRPARTRYNKHACGFLWPDAFDLIAGRAWTGSLGVASIPYARQCSASSMVADSATSAVD